MFKDVKEIYGACVCFPKGGGEIKFNYSAMEVKKCYPAMLELQHPYFISRNNSTHYFGKRMFDKEYEITDELTVFYSESKEKCVEWLKSKREEFLRSYKINLERLEKSEVREKIEEFNL